MLVVGSSISFRAQAQDPNAPGGIGQQSPLGPDASFDPNQKIKAGFDINVQVSSAGGVEADLSGAFKVDAAGSINIKSFGGITVVDLTPTQAADVIAAKIKVFINNPSVKVSISAGPRPTILLSGSVVKPGSNIINNGTTLAEALTVFGFTENADLSRIRVIHKDDSGKSTTKEFNFLKWLKPDTGKVPDETQNPVLLDRDFVFVPLRVIASVGSVKVEGAVTKPGLVPLDYGQPTELRQVIARAGGLTQVADKRQVAVRRFGVEKTMTLDADKIDAGDPANNILVQPDDIIFVSTVGPDQFINLTGAFTKPGRLPYYKPITLTQAVSDGGGLSPVAKANEGRVYRHVGGAADPTKTQVIAFNWDKIRANKQPDFMLEPGDTLEVLTGSGPKPQLSGLELAQSLLSIALIVDRLFNPGSSSNRIF